MSNEHDDSNTVVFLVVQSETLSYYIVKFTHKLAEDKSIKNNGKKNTMVEKCFGQK